MSQHYNRTEHRRLRDVRLPDVSGPRRTAGRPVQAGEKEFFDPDSPADFREYLVVLSYGRR